MINLLRLRFAVLIGMVSALETVTLHAEENHEELTSVVGVRGLGKNDAGKKNAGRDLAAVKRLEEIEITRADLEAFIKEGKLPL